MTSEDTASPAQEPQKRSRGWLIFLRDIVVIVVIAVVVSFLIKSFVVRSFYIPSSSMEDTLAVNDRILVDELTPRWDDYSRGDIVVFSDPGGWLPPVTKPERSPFEEGVDWLLSVVGLTAPDSEDHLVKRIIGVPGDHVVCCNAVGQITINGTPIDELSYLKLPAGDTHASNDAFEVTVPSDALWVMGDNRDRSRDSRYNRDQPGEGFVPLENVVGRVFLRTWPLDRFGAVNGHHEVFTGIPDAADAAPAGNASGPDPYEGAPPVREREDG